MVDFKPDFFVIGVETGIMIWICVSLYRRLSKKIDKSDDLVVKSLENIVGPRISGTGRLRCNKV